MIEEGKPAPDFTLLSDKGESVTLSSFRGKKVVLYFYPKDDTPGCTVEACEFRDAYDRFLEKGAVVIGISADSGASHAKFRDHHKLPFWLLADTDRTVLRAYGALGEKSMFGKTYEGILRSTFVIDADGKVLKVFPKVKPAGHAGEILAIL
jgi:thioredoxin-dependent peroxiredoxin